VAGEDLHPAPDAQSGDAPDVPDRPYKDAGLQETEDRVEAMDMAEAVEAIDLPESVEPADLVEVVDIVEATDKVEIVDIVEATDKVEADDVVETADGFEIEDALDTAELVEFADLEETDETQSLCGNGVIDWEAGEECDPPNGIDCNDSCHEMYCGNGVLDPGEFCDDGNWKSGDGCSPDCQLEYCGNGICEPNELPTDCPEDCGDIGDGVCETQFGETCENSPEDCGPCCPNTVCEPEYGENCESCPDDCPSCDDCGLISWSDTTPMPQELNGAAAGLVQGKVCVAGGRKGYGLIVDSFVCLDEGPGTWEDKESMLKSTYAAGYATLGDRFFVVGGYNKTDGQHNFCQFYQPGDGWVLCSPMPTPRAGVCSAAREGWFYAVGGWDGVEYKDAFEEYDVLTDSWSLLPPLPTARTGPETAILGDRLYAIGGYSDALNKYTDLVEVYDFDSGTWSTGDPLLYGVGGATVVSIPAKQIILIIAGYKGGGFGSIDTTDKVQCYRPTPGIWTLYDEPLPGIRANAAAVYSPDFPGKLFVTGGEPEYMNAKDTVFVGTFGP